MIIEDRVYGASQGDANMNNNQDFGDGK